jgi:hypothetical protein
VKGGINRPIAVAGPAAPRSSWRSKPARFTKLVFRTMLLPRAWRTEDFARMLARLTFRHTDISPDAIGMEVWLDT